MSPQDDERTLRRVMGQFVERSRAREEDRGATLARMRLAEAGIAASDFRADPIEWSPPSLGFSGELELQHRLGRLPTGIFLVRQSLNLSWFVTPAQFARWTKERVYIQIAGYHHWEYGNLTHASGNVSATATLVRPRPSGCTLRTQTGIQDNSATDRPPTKLFSFTVSNGMTTALTFRYANEATQAFNQQIHFEVETNLDKDDSFVWQVI